MRIKYKETPAPAPYDISEFTTKWTWITCDKCRDKIKQEPVWRVAVVTSRWGMEYNPSGFTKCLCKECFPTLESAKAYCDKMAYEDG